MQYFRFPSPFSSSGLLVIIEAALAAFFPSNIVAQDIHNAASVNINGSAGAWVAFGAAITIPANTKMVQISSNLGQPVAVSFAPNLGAAGTTATQINMVAGGAPGKAPFIPGANNKIFIRSLSVTAISAQYITVNFYG